MAIYSLGGFFLAPVIVKWQLEKQVQQQLAYRITSGEVRVNPFTLTVEINDLDLRDPAGGAVIAFSRLFVDFEMRSLIDRAWTFSEVTLEGPAINMEIDKRGRFNWLTLIERLHAPASNEDNPLPRLFMRNVRVSGGELEFLDRTLAQPLITRITPIAIEFTDLSTLPARTSPYRIAGRTAAGADIRWSGKLTVDPLESSGKFTIVGMKVATLTRALHDYVSIAAPAGDIDLSTNYRFAYADGKVTGGLDAIQAAFTTLSLSTPGADSPLLALGAGKCEDGRIDFSGRKIAARRLTLAKGHINVKVNADGKNNWQALFINRRPTAGSPSTAAPAKSGVRDSPWHVAVATVDAANVAVSIADGPGARSATAALARLNFAADAKVDTSGVRATFNHPNLQLSELTVTSGEGRAATGATLKSLKSEVLTADSKNDGGRDESTATVKEPDATQAGFAMTVQDAAFSAKQLALAMTGADLKLDMRNSELNVAVMAMKQGAASLATKTVTLRNSKLTIANGDQNVRISGEGARLAVSSLAFRQGGNGFEASSAEFKGASVSISGPRGAAQMNAAVESAGLTISGVIARAGSSKVDLLQMGGASVDATSLRLAMPATGFDVIGEGLKARLSDVAVNDPRGAQAVAHFKRADLNGGVLRSQDRYLAFDRVAFAEGGVQTEFEKAGGLNWSRMLRDLGASAPAGRKKGAARTAPAWRVAAKSLELKNFAAGLKDNRHSLPTAITFEKIEARLAGVDTGSNAMALLDLRADVKEGGQIEAKGKISPVNGNADLQVKVSAFVLAPAQPYIAQVARLALISGTLSAEGRLRYGNESGNDMSGAMFSFEGGAGIDHLKMEETQPNRPLIRWDSATAANLALTVSPNRLSIGELRLNGPVGALIIAQDHSVSVAKLVRHTARPASAAPTADSDFPVTVERVRIERGVLEFADSGLRPPFSTRMYELKGVITSLSTDPASLAKLQLDARVDEFGLAKIEGEMNPLRPKAYADVAMTFRNLDVKKLTPYTAKFAGYRIASGSLSVDLRYHIKDNHLIGDNKIVLNKLKLGEKVKSPDALDFSLDMAIALLQDVNGVIDIGVPVTGDLTDPKFDFGSIMGKAIGNLLIGIVTAPFRALAAMFGGGAKDLGTIDFDAGTRTLSPPERQKVQTVAQALSKRPNLRLVVHPAYAARADLVALKSVAARRAVTERMGIQLAPAEDPGPVDLSNPRAQLAVEEIFAQRYAPSVLDALKVRQAQNPAGATGDQTARALQWHRLLLDRLIAAEPVDERALRELAVSRGQAIVSELISVRGVDTKLISTAAVTLERAVDAKTVTVALELRSAP
ncbi:MAG: DUF748 domain-containing protein [Burkholderiales bacterium]